MVIGDRNWRQVNDTLGLSWNQVSTVCSPISGICNGSTGGVDFNGWTWASTVDIAELFAYFNPNFIVPTHTVAENNSEWGPNFLNAFDPSPSPYFLGDSEIVLGISRRSVNLFGDEMVFYGYVTDNSSVNFSDTMSNARTISIYNDYEGNGVWLYRDAIQIPEPSTYLLMGIGILGLFYSYRRNI